MNAARLREIIDLLLDKEKEFGVQDRLTELNQSLTELVSQPQDSATQNKFSEALERFKNATASVRASIEPAQLPLLEEIRGGPGLRDRMAAWLRWILGSIMPPISPRLPA